MTTEKADVREFWNRAACGEEQLHPALDRAGYEAQRAERYRLEPFIPAFAGFDRCRRLKTLEIGAGLGVDHQSFGEGGVDLHGIDLTERAIEHTARRLALFCFESRLPVGDAENRPFTSDTFKLVDSSGVFHRRGPFARSTACSSPAARRIWPRWFLRRFARHRGLFMLIECVK